MSVYVSYVNTPYGVEGVKVFNDKQQATQHTNQVDGEFVQYPFSQPVRSQDQVYVCVNESSKTNKRPLISIHTDVKQAQCECAEAEFMLNMQGFVHPTKIK